MKKRDMIFCGVLAAAGASIAVNTAGLASPVGIVEAAARVADPKNVDQANVTGPAMREGDAQADEPRRTVRVVYPSPYAFQQK